MLVVISIKVSGHYKIDHYIMYCKVFVFFSPAPVTLGTVQSTQEGGQWKRLSSTVICRHLVGENSKLNPGLSLFEDYRNINT